jgi:rhodanese-related sulfurtransferase
MSLHLEQSDRQRLDHELDQRALRHAVWIGVREAQRLQLHDIAGQLTSILVRVDELRELDEAAA